MPAGRPTEYNSEIIKKAKDYLNNLPEGEVVHSIEGLGLYLGIDRSTIYDWESQEEKKEFSYIVESIRQKQAQTLINKGLENKFNSSITKVMLTKHGYREGIENTGKDGKDLIPPTLSEEEKEKLKKLFETSNK
jgi:hypothetical protein